MAFRNSFYECRQYSQSSSFHQTEKALPNATPLFMCKLNKTQTYDVHVLILNFLVDANNVHECGPCKKKINKQITCEQTQISVGKTNTIIIIILYIELNPDTAECCCSHEHEYGERSPHANELIFLIHWFHVECKLRFAKIPNTRKYFFAIMQA